MSTAGELTQVGAHQRETWKQARKQNGKLLGFQRAQRVKPSSVKLMVIVCYGRRWEKPAGKETC